MDDPRQSAFMPTIKCSNCGNQVEISMMGEHVCGSTPAAAEPPPPMPDVLGGAFSSLKANVFDKFSRAAPPSVDTSAANRAFQKTEQLTPISSSTGSQAISPKTPTHQRPGADFNKDDYYAPAIAGSPRRPSGYGGFGDPGSLEADSTYGTSPNKSSNFLARMNMIAPGPFEMNRKPGLKNPFARNDSQDHTAESNDDSLRVRYSMERPGTSGSTSSKNSNGLAPPRAPRANGYSGFGAPKRGSNDLEPAPLGLGRRSETFPDRLQANDEVLDVPERVPSAPGMRSDRMRSSSNSAMDRVAMANEGPQQPSFGAQDALRPPPLQGTGSRPPTRDGSRKPSVNLGDEFNTNNRYHSSSISQSSSNSGYTHSSRPSQASSNTSPARSVNSRPDARRPSDMSGFDALLDDLQSSMDAMQTKPQSPSPRERSASGRGSEPPRLSSRFSPPEHTSLDAASFRGQDPRVDMPVIPPIPFEPSDRSSDRRDPAIQDGLSQSPPTRPTHNRQASKSQNSRGNCKACKEPITGKSISSADGRLTGRYHKACFVCTTCREPFSSSTFYVLNDQPYCEQHYHRLNGSLCGSCNIGIEGQYLEDESSKKYHPNCFRCGDCGIVLRDGYFDVDGRSYCERDAWKRIQFAMQAQRQYPPSLRPGYPPRRPSGQMQGPPPPRPPRPGPGSGFVGPSPMGPSPMGPGPKGLNRPFGLPTGSRLAPGQALGRGGLASPIPRMEKRMTRMGML
ncbi:uncharacterized protein F4812DRAFT_90115 [Daldinia caldariorum]|uniref:uncharacterized protein n=1 Tax=Daldinia caldariorum TaxID=326644 RepID=UPI002007A121|nr:uncharacterized protein F4812DRAFT_90115 [Daldinia caldariorum]KAI1465943.1 hypothetical protein F4812DRAFT_90115 [Daldinia caldariorum]